MHRSNDDRWILSPTDLVGFLACPQLAELERARRLGLVPAPPKYDDPGLEALRRRGKEHEDRYLDRLRAGGNSVAVISRRRELHDYAAESALASAETLSAMRTGVDVVYQGCLTDDRWVGWADFLVRVEKPSALGAWSYEVVDTKLAREAKGGALLQILLYSDLLHSMQGVPPEKAFLALGGPERPVEEFRVADYAAYFRSVRSRYGTWFAGAGGAEYAPDPVEHCGVCDWKKRCDGERRAVDHLSLVAGITRRQRDGLRPAGVNTLEALGSLDAGVRIDEVRPASLARVRNQARIQLQGRVEGRNVHELLKPIEEGLGLAALPEPCEGDLFLDFEGDPFALEHGLEYLVGWCDTAGNYTGRWAVDRAGEKVAFEDFVDLVTERRAQWPDMHVYHYAAYERTALGRLMGLHATREKEVDDLFREGVLVDLFRVVRQGLRASVESYSIKKMEPFYGFERSVELNAATRSLVSFGAWLQAGIGERAPEMQATIEGYNRDDVLSTRGLRDWLEALRDEAAGVEGTPVPRPAPTKQEEGAEERDDEVAKLVARLSDGVPAEDGQRSDEERARWLMAYLLEFHRREDKPAWWEYFRCLDLKDDELVEDRATLGGLEYVGVERTDENCAIHRYRFPHQDHGLKKGTTVVNPVVEKEFADLPKGQRRPPNLGPGEIVGIDDGACTIDLKRPLNSKALHPTALVAKDIFYTTTMRESLLRLGREVDEHGLGDANPYSSVADLLMRKPPRVGHIYGDALSLPGEDTVSSAKRLAAKLDRSYLPIQGPPGAGKTFTASHVIVDALRRGCRVGVTATGHAVITQLMDRVMDIAGDESVQVVAVQKASEDDRGSDRADVRRVDSNAKVEAALRDGATLVGGTPWLWSRGEMAGAVDLLVVDEAGQFSLANALAVAPAAKNLVLVGDPQQLEQPIKGTHPPGVGVSVLSHALGRHETVPVYRGLFLDRTWRLHPEVCRFTSEAFYEGRLEPQAGLEGQRIRGPRLEGSGLRLVTTAHEGNTTESPEEAAAIAGMVAELVGGHTWVNREGEERPMAITDILVVAPYNVQVGAIKALLPADARIGTVDKFQGQEAPVVIYSVTSSSAEDAPRGMGFLYSPNRLNVATSRAKCLAILVAAPAIFAPECRTPAQMKLANAFCRFAELAVPLSPHAPGRPVTSVV